jgi:transcriptional regulator with XRE-family HTH domain
MGHMNMDRSRFRQLFAKRLVDSMITQGHTSSGKLGIDIKELANVTGASYQMARKYALGLVLPDLIVFEKLSSWLEVSPSWLLFGNEPIDNVHTRNSSSKISIDIDLLKYILNKSVFLFSLSDNPETITNFLIDTIYDAVNINADLTTIHKIVDSMIASTTLLRSPKAKKIL